MPSRFICTALVAALLAAAAPSLTSAAVTINLSPTFVTPLGFQTDAVVPIEVFALDLDGTDERLNAYTVAVEGAGVGGSAFGDPNGVRFVVPPPNSTFGIAGRPTEHPYVFKDFETIPPIEDFNSTPAKLQFAATAVGQDDAVDIDPTHNGFLRFGVVIPANAPPGTWTIAVTTNSLAGLGPPIVSTPGTPATIVFFPVPPDPNSPEPSAAALLLFPTVALLRRRRA